MSDKLAISPGPIELSVDSAQRVRFFNIGSGLGMSGICGYFRVYMGI